MAPVKFAPVQPTDAIAFFRAKGFRIGFAWQDIWQEEHAKAFTVAKAMDADLLADIRDAVDQALANGTTFDTFKKELTPKLKSRGWWGQKPLIDPQTGEPQLVQLGSDRRLATIFDINVRTAYAAGAWVGFQRSKRYLPYLKYNHLDPQPHPRPEHQAWNGIIVHIDDPWLDEHYPPCDWGCHCWMTALTPSQARREKRWGEKPAVFPKKAYRNPRTGQVVELEQGIGPGWAYNVGKSYLESLSPPPLKPRAVTAAEPGVDLDELQRGQPSAEPLTPLPSPRVVPERQIPIPGADEDEAIANFLGGFAASPDETLLYADQAGDRLAIGPGLFRDAAGHAVPLPAELVKALPVIGVALREPMEIRSVWTFGPPRAGQPPLSMLVRRYIARVMFAGKAVDVVVDVGKQGWTARTSIEDAALRLDDWRRGFVLWPPKPQP
jgi:hypothetical protein